MAAPVAPDNMPTTASYVFATAIIAGVVGYFAGQGASLGLFSSSPATAGRSTSKRATKEKEAKEELESEEEEDSEGEGDGAELATFEGNNDEVKLVLVVRTDLGIGAREKSPLNARMPPSPATNTTSPKPPTRPSSSAGEHGGQAKVALQVKTEEEMLVLQAQAMSLGLCARVIQDAGRTQIASGSRTVLGVLGTEDGG